MIRMLPVNYCPSCPICGTREIALFAVVDSDIPGHPPHSFWGEAGGRAIVHTEGAWCHIRVGREHRLAFLTLLALPKHETEAGVSQPYGN